MTVLVEKRGGSFQMSREIELSEELASQERQEIREYLSLFDELFEAPRPARESGRCRKEAGSRRAGEVAAFLERKFLGRCAPEDA